MIKLIVSDIDGTVLEKGQEQMRRELYLAFEKLREKSIQLAFASGRSVYAMKSILGSLCDNAYLISTEGAACVKDGKVLYTRVLSASDVLKVVRAEQYENCAVVAATPLESYVLRKKELLTRCNEPMHADVYKEVSGIYDIKEPIIKVSVFSPEQNPRPLYAGTNSMRVCYNANGWCEYVSAIANKGLAVSDLQMRLYLSKYDTACFGDGENDVEMMKKARIAVSVNQSAKALDGVCGHHTDNLEKTLLDVADGRFEV